MANLKNTKRALLFCMLSMLVCFAMLIGSTFAWFTDSVTSANNKIVAGNLKVALQYSVDGNEWKNVDENTNMFKEDGLWEPGYTEVVYLRVVNEGTLALKYRFGMNVVSEVKGTNVFGEAFQLSKYIQFGIVEVEEAFTDRQSAIDAVSSKATAVANGYSSDEGHLTKGNTSNMLALVVYMPTNVENEANYKKDTKAPEINLGVTLVATQDAAEEDSFGSTYDQGIWIGGTDTTWYNENATEYSIDTPEQLAGLAKLVNAKTDFTGKIITLNNDINLNNSVWTPIGSKEEKIYFTGTFDGNNKTINGLNITSGDYVGLFGAISGATIKNLTVVGSINGENASAIAARMESGTIENCTSYVNVISSGKAGGIVCLTNTSGCELLNCNNYGTVNGGTKGATGGVGGIVAYANPNTIISGCKNFGDVGTKSDKYSGGIVGYACKDNSSVTNCVNNGTIVSNADAGGIISISTNAWTVTGSTNNGKVEAGAVAGGIIGAMQNGKVENCANTAAIKANFAGGIVGNTGGAPEIINCSGGTAEITTPAYTLGFTGHELTIQFPENACAGRLIGANGGGGASAWTKLTIDDTNGDDTSIGAVGICGPYTTWANLEVISGTFYGDPVAGNTTYIKINEGVTWKDREPGTYVCGGVTEQIRKNEWTKQ